MKLELVKIIECVHWQIAVIQNVLITCQMAKQTLVKIYHSFHWAEHWGKKSENLAQYDNLRTMWLIEFISTT